MVVLDTIFVHVKKRAACLMFQLHLNKVKTSHVSSISTIVFFFSVQFRHFSMRYCVVPFLTLKTEKKFLCLALCYIHITCQLYSGYIISFYYLYPTYKHRFTVSHFHTVFTTLVYNPCNPYQFYIFKL